MKGLREIEKGVKRGKERRKGRCGPEVEGYGRWKGE